MGKEKIHVDKECTHGRINLTNLHDVMSTSTKTQHDKDLMKAHESQVMSQNHVLGEVNLKSYRTKEET